ncbi:transposable element Tcb2 transposase [Trichonephila clavipes]|uniref:Transposable element Tcb2 transposase n=1 Tax=Trichonephila clavipes TaxID=2585209 RepID=A0A8X6STI1_TRICX|nr:transposable element Tcb2 transposase [Trichonephila clavipes]
MKDVRRPVVCTTLSSVIKRVRLKRCRDHKDKSMDQWMTILYTDESQCSLASDSNRTFIWGELWTHFLSSNVREMGHYDSGGLIVWASITLNSRTHLHVFQIGTVTAVWYRDEVLELYVYLFRGAVGCDFILMYNNTSHIELIWVINFWKMRIFAEWIAS